MCNSGEILLCNVFINGGTQLAIGTKSRSIYVYNVRDGSFVTTLEGHRASVCALAVCGGVLASGGDNGCGALILWDTQTFKMKRKINLHKAALTCIADCGDGKHLISGGYDKKLCLLDYKTHTLRNETNNCRAGVTAVGVCGGRVVSTGLDSTVNIWTLAKKV